MRYSAPLLVSIASLVACSPSPQPPPMSESLRSDLQTIAQARVLFGHQSVGRDLLQGLQTLAKEADANLRIVEIKQPTEAQGAGVFHAFIGKNGDPGGKCEAFAGLLTTAQPAPAYDVAAIKFCYVDLGRESNTTPTRLLEQYASLVHLLHTVRPDVRLMHVTMPLRADPAGWKTNVKRLIGRATDEDADNILRNEFNDGLRKKFAAEPLFDLAQIESTLPDGSRTSFSAGGRTMYRLAGEYTTDGGHLNDLGKRRVAEGFAHAVAGILRDQPRAN
jgi:hypothetical protein